MEELDKKISRSERINAEESDKKRKKKRKILLVILIMLLLILGYIGLSFYKNLNNGFKESTKTVQVDPNLTQFSVLVMGIDENDSRAKQGQTRDKSRTDALVYMAVNKDTKRMDMVSIPRDSLSLMRKREDESDLNSYFFDKINHAYAYGGVDGTIESVSNLLNVPVNFYIIINFKAFEKVVDSLGGVEVYVPFDMKEQNANGERDTINLKKGWHTLKGADALAFTRSRYYDSDIDRGQRQLQVIHAVIDKAKSLGALTKINELIEIGGNNVTHNLSLSEIATIASIFTTNDIDIVSHKIGGYDAQMEGVYYYYPKPLHLQYISSVINYNLGKPLPRKGEIMNIAYQNHIVPLNKNYSKVNLGNIESKYEIFDYVDLSGEDNKNNLKEVLLEKDLANDPTVSNENRPT